MKGKIKNRKEGGRTHEWVSGNPDVKKELGEHESGNDEKKHGGKVKKHRAKGGKVIGLMTGGAVRPRLDRPGRKRGGGVGSDRSPLSSAHSGGHESPKLPREKH